MKLLVTGGAGYIGGIVTTMLLDAGHDVTVVDDLATSPAGGVPPGATFVECGVRAGARGGEPAVLQRRRVVPRSG